jgi:FAS-associated factor 2
LTNLFISLGSFFESTSMPIDYDPLANIAEYAIQYNQKYGMNHVDFYQGSYSQAVNEAKRDLKFLMVYLHQNDNKDCNTFATETMTNPDLVEFLNNSVLFWSCSKNLPEGHKVFNALKAKRCPFIGVIVYKHSRMTLVSKIEGPITAAELMLQMSNLIAEHEHDLIVARNDREQRSQTQLLRQQQDEAYLESLKQDREKQRKKQQEEMAKKQEQELELKRQEEEIARENVNIFLKF